MAETTAQGGRADEDGELRVAASGVERFRVEEQAVVVAVKGCDSSYLQMVVPCSLHKSSADFAAVRLLCELLSMSEGLMWARIRGKGLAYGAGLDVLPWNGQILFSLSECADPAAATAEMFAIIHDCREQLVAQDESGKSALRALLSEARASLLFSLHSKRATPNAASSTAAKSYWWAVEEPESEAEQEASAIEAVEAGALVQALDRYLAPLLTPGQRCTCVAVPAGKDKEICSSLEKVLHLESGGVTIASLAQLTIPGDE